MKTRRVYKCKLDAAGNLKKHRARIVAEGFTQIQHVNYFETFAPVAHSSTIRLILPLTSLPASQAYQFDVSVAFIEAPLDDNEPNIYLPDPTTHLRPRADCPSPEATLILISYVDDPHMHF